jgi:hypothetical protein
LTVLLVMAVTGAAYGLSYVPGAYNVDSCAITTSKPCSTDSSGALRMKVTKGHFNVRRVSLTETCDNGVSSFKEKITFIAGANAKLAGRVGSEGRFHGRYQNSGGFFKVTGRVQGRRLTATFHEEGSFTRGGEPTFSCAGSITFHARRS